MHKITLGRLCERPHKEAALSEWSLKLLACPSSALVKSKPTKKPDAHLTISNHIPHPLDYGTNGELVQMTAGRAQDSAAKVTRSPDFGIGRAEQ